jgi:hypothetical protein
MSALQGAVESGAPVSRLHERQSFDPADFGVPSGREEEWRFTPLRRLRGLHTDETPLSLVTGLARGRLLHSLRPHFSTSQIGRNGMLLRGSRSAERTLAAQRLGIWWSMWRLMRGRLWFLNTRGRLLMRTTWSWSWGMGRR